MSYMIANFFKKSSNMTPYIYLYGVSDRTGMHEKSLTTLVPSILIPWLDFRPTTSAFDARDVFFIGVLSVL